MKDLLGPTQGLPRNGVRWTHLKGVGQAQYKLIYLRLLQRVNASTAFTDNFEILLFFLKKKI